MAFIFGGNTPWTYEQLQRKRAVADSLLGSMGEPKNVGEGLAAIGKALAYRGIEKRAGKEEARMRGEFDAKWGALLGGYGGAGGNPVSTGQPGYSGAPAPAFTPPDPNSPGAIAGDAMAALGKQVYTPGDKESFIKAMMPHAIKVSQETGLDPRLVIAQAAQETGWGKSAPGNNFFGIKSHGKAGGNTFATNEVIDGQTVRINDSFRGYDSMGDSAMGYAEFLKENPRYGEMLAAGDLDGQLAALGASGYATDPNYASSVGNIARGIGLPENFTPGQGAAPQGGAPQGGMGGMDIGALVGLASDPMASPAQKAVVEALIQQQLQAADPLRAIEMQKAQLELAQLQNPTDAPPEDFTARMFTLNALGMDPQSPEGQHYMLTGQLPDTAGGNRPAAFQSLDLQAQAAGFAPGTPEYQEFMRNGGASGTPAAFTALDLQARAAGYEPGTPEYQRFMASRGAYERSSDAAIGKAQGEDAALYESMTSKMPGLESVVDELSAIADEATYTSTGQAANWIGKQLGFEPSEAAVARTKYIAMVDNQVLPMLRDTFGAAFTVAEGESLRATLGDPNKTPEEKKVVLEAFIEQKKRDVEALGRRVNGSETPAAPATGATVPITSDAEYDALPSGTMFQGPDGKVRRKP